jgi:hypothetical protein
MTGEEMLIVLAALLTPVFGLAASFLMSRASNSSAAANIAFGALFSSRWPEC